MTSTPSVSPGPDDDHQPTIQTTATTALTEAIDDFLGDVEKKFKGISNEILSRLDDMAERCDRLEQEMMERGTDGGGGGRGSVGSVDTGMVGLGVIDKR
ncbi:hypothetical protein DV736_g273, partial [Chaetothyriales sp. CBS 134916]